MGSFSSFLSDAGDFLQNTVLPVATGLIGAQLGLAPAGGAAPAQTPVPAPPTITTGVAQTRLPFGLSPLMIGLIVGGVLLLIFVLMM